MSILEPPPSVRSSGGRIVIPPGQLEGQILLWDEVAHAPVWGWYPGTEPSTLLSADSFDRADGPLVAPWVQAQGIWTLTGGKLFQTTTITNSLVWAEVPIIGTGNFALDVDFALSGSGSAGLLFGSTDQTFRIIADLELTYVEVARVVAGGTASIVRLLETSGQPAVPATGHLTMTVIGSQVTLKLGGVQKITFTLAAGDTPPATNRVAGVFNYAVSGMNSPTFDNFAVTLS